MNFKKIDTEYLILEKKQRLEMLHFMCMDKGNRKAMNMNWCRQERVSSWKENPYRKSIWIFFMDFCIWIFHPT